MRSAKTEPKFPVNRHDNHSEIEPTAATDHTALSSASASIIHVNQEVVIRDGSCQGSGGAPGGAATPEAKDEHGQVRQRSLLDRSAPLSGRQPFLRTSDKTPVGGSVRRLSSGRTHKL